MTKVLDIIGANKLLNPIYKKYLWGNKHLTQIYFGGSSSGKSFAIAQRAVLDVLNGRNYLVVRKTGASIAKSSFNEIREKIYQFKLQSFFRINASAFTITCTLNNCQFIFTGLDDVEKVKSIRPLSGVITDIWIEEATEISVNDYRQLTKRLRGVSRFPKRITMSFNPILKTHWIYKEFFATLWRDDQQYVEDKTTSILKTTYKDNVHLMPDDIERLESETDPYYRDVYLLGNWGTLAGVIYNNWRVEDFDKESFENYRCGLDFGFACLSGETLVDTDLGKKKLKDIKIGDKVLTRQGFRKVIHTQCNGQKEVYAVDFGYNKSIIATPDHRVFTCDGWKRVDELGSNEKICEMRLSLMGRFIGVILKGSTQIISIIKRKTSIGSTIEIFGNFIRGVFQMGTLYTIKTATLLIMIFQILFVLPQKITQKYIIKTSSELFQKINKKRCGQSTDIQKKTGNNVEKNQLQQHKREEGYVKSAECLTRLLTFTKNTVRQLVEREPILGTAKRNISAKYVASSLWLRRIISEQRVLKNVHIKRQLLSQKETVYDITVENGEYFANGILVHNCDPFAFVRIAIDTKRKIIHVCDEIYQTELLNDKAIQLVKPIARGGIVWCDSAEPKSIAEFRANGINARPVKKGQGSIEQGINFLKRFQIIVHPFCVNTIKELSTYHYKTDRATGEPLPVPADVDNHICVAKGTMVFTDKGNVAIEDIKVGDFVFTRMGYKKIVDQALTAHNANVVTLKTTKNELQLTKNHKVFCVNKACFVSTDALRYGDDILILEDSPCRQKKFIITAKNIIAILIQVILTTGIISSVAGSIYIIKYGKIITENVKKAFISIIKTTIPQTTVLRILNKYRLKNTHRNTGQKNEARSKKRLWMKLDRLQVNGTGQKQEVNGINNTQKTSILDTFNMGKQSVLFAKLNLLKHKIFRFFVLINAKLKIEEIAEQITSQGFVFTVKKNFKLINIQKQKLAPDTVVSVIDGNKKSDVYNITVEDAHEFLANGILVKNCDALRYATEADALMRGTIKDVL